MNNFHLAAGVVSGLIAALHIVVGGTVDARPLLRNTTLRPSVKFTHYYCWHLVSLTLVAITVVFLLTASSRLSADAAICATALAAAFSLFGLFLAPIVKQPYRSLPQGWLFAPVAILGALGLAAG